MTIAALKKLCSQVPWCEPAVLESTLELALEIAREGREGRRIGTLFTLGKAEAVLAASRALILDPLAGHTPARTHISIGGADRPAAWIRQPPSCSRFDFSHAWCGGHCRIGELCGPCVSRRTHRSDPDSRIVAAGPSSHATQHERSRRRRGAANGSSGARCRPG